MPARYHRSDFQYQQEDYERLAGLAEHRHVTIAACHRLAAATAEHRHRHEEMARQSADEAAAPDRRDEICGRLSSRGRYSG